MKSLYKLRPLPIDIGKIQYVLMAEGFSRHQAILLAHKCYAQVKKQGFHNFVSYLKKAGQQLLYWILKDSRKVPYVKTYRGFPVFYKDLGHLSIRTLVRLTKFARGFVLHELSVFPISSRDKELPAIQNVGTPVSPALHRKVTLVVASGVFSYGKPQSPSHFDKEVDSLFKLAPDLSQVELDSNLAQLTRFLDPNQDGTVNQQFPGWEKVLYPLDPTVSVPFMQSCYTKYSDVPAFIGKVHASHEGGCKTRLFASPKPVFQALSTGLYQWLVSYRDTFTTDCSKDQIQGAYWVADQLRKGKVIHSIDQSSATHLFPLWVQKEFLTQVGAPQHWIDLVDYTASGKWTTSRQLRKSGFPKSMNWTVGQPLGLLYSIALYGVVHNLILAGLCQHFGKVPEDTFRILGDDVVISDCYIAEVYKTLILDLGCKISEEKSFSSNKYAEFAGFSVLKTADGQILNVRPGQWKDAREKILSHVASRGEVIRYPGMGTSMLDIQQVWLTALGLPTHDTDIHLASLIYRYRKNKLYPTLVNQHWTEATYDLWSPLAQAFKIPFARPNFKIKSAVRKAILELIPEWENLPMVSLGNRHTTFLQFEYLYETFMHDVLFFMRDPDEDFEAEEVRLDNEFDLAQVRPQRLLESFRIQAFHYWNRYPDHISVQSYTKAITTLHNKLLSQTARGKEEWRKNSRFTPTSKEVRALRRALGVARNLLASTPTSAYYRVIRRYGHNQVQTSVISESIPWLSNPDTVGEVFHQS